MDGFLFVSQIWVHLALAGIHPSLYVSMDWGMTDKDILTHESFISRNILIIKIYNLL